MDSQGFFSGTSRCHGNLTQEQLESGLFFTAYCFTGGGCQYWPFGAPFAPLDSEATSTTASPTPTPTPAPAPAPAPAPKRDFFQAFTHRPRNAGKPADSIIKSLSESMDSMQIDPTSHEEELNGSTQTLANRPLIALKASALKSIEEDLSRFSFTVEMPDTIKNEIATTSQALDEAAEDDRHDESDRPHKRVRVSAGYGEGTLPDRYIHWLGMGQHGPPPVQLPTEAEAEVDKKMKWLNRQVRGSGYTRALVPLGDWDDDDFNQFMHPCLPDVCYILELGENRDERERSMVEDYDFVLY